MIPNVKTTPKRKSHTCSVAATGEPTSSEKLIGEVENIRKPPPRSCFDSDNCSRLFTWIILHLYSYVTYKKSQRNQC
uniref:Uncharacterized protein n=1 Tax=Helianthus annuus TaxID=4232 RepID=A0A251RYV0_HELAN